ncbi:MAG: DUF167 domain-containing protein [Candidatus Nanoarchaeia archaeon]
MKIQIKVTPNSGEQTIKKLGEIYLVRLKSRPENNKANLELIKFLKKYFNSKDVKITSGLASRKKIVEVIK